MRRAGLVVAGIVAGIIGIGIISCAGSTEKRGTEQRAHECIETEYREYMPAGCETPGRREYWECKECGNKYADAGAKERLAETELPATGHEYKDKEVSPTCTEQGYTEHTCNNCGDMYRDTYTEKKEHEYEVKAEKKETCTENGETVYGCKTCGTEYTEVINKTGHKYRDKEVSPTCTEKGYTEHTCNNCGDMYRDTYTEKTEHEYEVKTEKEETCTENGETVYGCKTCGTEYTEEREKTGHRYDGGEVTEEPSCTDDGERTYTCERCGGTYKEEIEKIGHKYKDTVVSSTCTEKGYTEHTCSNCGEMYRDTYTEKKEHEYEVKTEKEETCTENGETVYGCKTCGTEYTEVREKTGHEYTEKEKAPTCTEQGYTEHTCKKCGEMYRDGYEDAMGHELYRGACKRCCNGGCELEYAENETGYGVVGIKGEVLQTLIIPREYNGKPVTRVEAGAFGGRTKIKYVYVSGSVEYIGANAFKGIGAQMTGIEFENAEGWRNATTEDSSAWSKPVKISGCDITTTYAKYYWIRREGN